MIIEGENVYTIIDPDLGMLNSANSPKKAVKGYYYVQTKNPDSEPGKANQYLLNAVSADYGNTGINTLYIYQKGIVIQTNNGARPIYKPLIFKKPSTSKPKVKLEKQSNLNEENL